MKIITLLILTSLLSLQASANSRDSVIYGEDNRVDVFESTDPAFVQLSRSTAAMIATADLKSKGKEVVISGSTLQERGICAKERFSKQISAANCSGFLVAPNVLVTAGHCIKTASDCSKYSWVFDYKIHYANQKNVHVRRTSVYSCKKIIEQSLDNRTKDDYAVIQLDRVVEDRMPLNFRRSGTVAPGTDLVVIGHPTGLPTKIADGAQVRSLENKYFVANLDTFGGNSGSAVFNVRTSEVEGILVRGENDYVRDPSGCMVSNVCDNDGCRGEDVTHITNIKALKRMRY